MDTFLLIGAAVVVVGVIVAKIGDRLGLPALLLFLGLGMLIGAPSAGMLFNNADLAHDLGFVALVLILADGGLSTKWRDVRPAIVPATLLASVGALVSIAIMSTLAHFVLGLPLNVSVLLAAILTPTDSAAVFSVLRSVPLPPRVRAIVEGESGLNDAPTVLLVIAATELALGTATYSDIPAMTVMIVVELAGGLALGVVHGFVGVRLLRNLALPASGLYPLAAIGWAVIGYGLGVVSHVSGFAAVYVCAVMLSNGKLPHRHATRSFAEGIGWIAQIGLFVMLGLLAVPSRITLKDIVIATLFGLLLTFVGRPISVLICLLPLKIPLREQAFISWSGLRGAVPIILATIPLAAGVASADHVFDQVFISTIVLTLLNAPSLPWVARKLGLVGETSDVDIEVAPLDQVEADLLQIRVSEDSKLHGVAVHELRLPPNCVVTLIIRGHQTFTPHGRDLLKAGDEVLVVTPSAVRGAVEDRLRAVDRGGRLVGWLDQES